MKCCFAVVVETNQSSCTVSDTFTGAVLPTDVRNATSLPVMSFILRRRGDWGAGPRTSFHTAQKSTISSPWRWDGESGGVKAAGWWPPGTLRSPPCVGIRLHDAELSQVAQLHVPEGLPGADDRGVCRRATAGQHNALIDSQQPSVIDVIVCYLPVLPSLGRRRSCRQKHKLRSSLLLWLWLQLDYFSFIVAVFQHSFLSLSLSLSFLSLFSHSPLLSSLRSFALELSALLLFEFGWSSFGSISSFDCCVHFCCDRKMQNKCTHTKVSPLDP